MYKTSTFITSLFCKFKVTDKSIREQIIKIYAPLIDKILSDLPDATRIRVFKELIPSMRSTIQYLESDPDTSSKSHQLALNAFKSNTIFSKFAIDNITVSGNDDVFKHIMKQVNIDDIACDIGSCIVQLKDNPTNEEEILSRLSVLLSDYNLITGDNLTKEKLLGLKEIDEYEL